MMTTASNSSSGLSKILDRARKLQALAERADSEHEAAAAASRLRLLVEAYHLDEAALRVAEPTRAAEPILRGVALEKGYRRRVAWREVVSAAVARSLGVHEYFTHFSDGTTEICGVGRETAIQTWQYTYQMLCRTIDGLAEAGWLAEVRAGVSTRHARSWCNAFRIGCASRIAERMEQQKRAEDFEAVAPVRDVPVVDTTPASSMALAIVEQDQAEVDREYATIRAGFKRAPAKAIGQTSSGSGYRAGRDAGTTVSIGGARAGLPAGQGRLGGGGK
jgi:hypothetical protein